MLETTQSETAVTSDARQELLVRILASAQFSQAPRLQRFLRYITDCYLRDHLNEINEQQIGVHVFDKSADYNPGEDNVVRSYARTLRKRLEEYFAKEGHAESLIIEVPRGGYVPVFIERIAGHPALPAQNASKTQGKQSDISLSEPSHSEEIRPITLVKQPEKWRLRFWIPLLLVVSLVTSTIAFKIGRQTVAPKTPPAVHSFWQQFVNGRSTILVPGDAGLTIILGLTKEGVTPPQYVTGAYVSQDADRQLLPEGWANTNVHRYTDLIDLKFISAISHLPELPMEKTTIRFARDLRADDLKEGNVVLIGGVNANPWVQLFDQKLNFGLEFVPQQRTFIVRNRKPITGELSRYPYGPENWSQVSYGLIALQPSITGSGYVLLVEGVAAAGLQGAAEYLLNESTMAPLLQQVTDSKGHLRPFEILLRTYNVGANATKTEIVGLRLD